MFFYYFLWKGAEFVIVFYVFWGKSEGFNHEHVIMNII